MNTSTIPNTGSTHETAPIEDNAAEIRDALGVPSSSEVVKLSGDQTIAGNKTFTGQVELTGQAAANPTSAMTRQLILPEVMVNPGGLKMPRVFYLSTNGVGSSHYVIGDD